MAVRSGLYPNKIAQAGSRSKQPFFLKQNKPKEQRDKFFAPKLIVGQPNDKYEKEADSMADHVVNTLDKSPAATVQRKCKQCEAEEEKVQPKMEDEEDVQLKSAEEDEPVQKKPATEEEENVQLKGVEEEDLSLQKKESEEEEVQLKSEAPHANQNQSLSAQLTKSAGSGSRLPLLVRNQMENSFGADFSQVNIHTDNAAIQMNKDLHAQAFTHGADIYFNKGKYDPSSSGGKRLLAHELTHVVQQTAPKSPMTQTKGSNGQQGSLRRRPLTHGDLPGKQRIQRAIGDGHDLLSPPLALDPVLEATFDNERFLQRGNQGSAVRRVQEGLITLGFQLSEFGADGIFGKETEKQVIQYQSSKAIDADGIVGPVTLGMLDSDLAAPAGKESDIANIDIPDVIEAGETVSATARTTSGDLVSGPVTWRLLHGPPGSKIEETSSPETAVVSPASGTLTMTASKSPPTAKTVKVVPSGAKVCQYTFPELDASKASGGKVAQVQGTLPMILWFDFESGKSIIRSNHKAAIEKLIKIDKLDEIVPLASIRFIFGFSDCVGQESKNLNVRTDRATALRDEFISSGARSVHIGPAAPSRPGAELGNNFTPEGRARNRSALIVSEIIKPEQPKQKKKLEDIIGRLRKIAETIDIKNQRDRLLCLLDMIMDKSKDDHYINGFDHIVKILAKGKFPKLNNKDFATFVLNNSARKDMTNPSFTPEQDDLVRENLKRLDERILSGINLIFDQSDRNSQLNFNNPVLRQMNEFVSIQQRNRDSIYFCYGKGQK